MAYNICIGIPSYLPTEESARSKRITKLNNLLQQISLLWPTIDILIIAQNWQDFQPCPTRNKLIIQKYQPLGILQARKILGNEFLKLNYDYIIMMDDDIQIEFDDDSIPLKFIAEINKHENGFCFIHGQNNPYHPYIGTQLNLCAISKFIYEHEPMVDIDPQKDEGYEDTIYACLLHHKWAKYEFNPPIGIRPIQWQPGVERTPSTWADSPHNISKLHENSDKIQKYIVKYKKFPEHYK